MTYGEIRDAALMLIGQYTIASSPYEDTYNNQADYVLKVPFLINDCLIYIASSVRRLPAEYTLNPEDGEEYGNWLRFHLPNDLLDYRPGGLLVPDADLRRGESTIWTHYKIEDPDYILLPKSMDRPMIMPYYRKPKLLPLGAEPGYEMPVDAPVTVQMAIPYYVAAHLVMEDDSFRYASLQNEFENKLARITPAPYTEIQGVHDAYGLDDGWYDPAGVGPYYGGWG